MRNRVARGVSMPGTGLESDRCHSSSGSTAGRSALMAHAGMETRVPIGDNALYVVCLMSTGDGKYGA